MKKCASLVLALALANTGCWECCQLCQKKTVAAPTPAPTAEAKPARQPVVSADQVNKQNAREIAENLRLELDRDAK